MSPPIRELIIATGNPHKVREITRLLADTPVRARALTDFPDLPEPDEDADTFEANARLKALYYARALRLQPGQACLADDSGLEVDALHGAPGVRSARYAGTGDTRAQRDEANNAKLLHALRAVPDEQRTARFVCALCVAASSGVLFETRGEFSGLIARAPTGDNGFGYDPLLFLPDGRTSAQLTPHEKDARSHRGAALRNVAHWLANAP